MLHFYLLQVCYCVTYIEAVYGSMKFFWQMITHHFGCLNPCLTIFLPPI